jgi:hypothetical protein
VQVTPASTCNQQRRRRVAAARADRFGEQPDDLPFPAEPCSLNSTGFPFEVISRLADHVGGADVVAELDLQHVAVALVEAALADLHDARRSRAHRGD